jgi:hypothetical protein
MTGDDTTFAWAVRLAKEGFACFPCRADKRPATPHGFKDATGSVETIGRLWSDYPGPLIGVPTGEPSGIAVLDIDPRHGGKAWFAEHRNRIPATRVHRTQSGGLHFFFQHRKGCGAASVRSVPESMCVRSVGTSSGGPLPECPCFQNPLQHLGRIGSGRARCRSLGCLPRLSECLMIMRSRG